MSVQLVEVMSILTVVSKLPTYTVLLISSILLGSTLVNGGGVGRGAGIVRVVANYNKRKVKVRKLNLKQNRIWRKTKSLAHFRRKNKVKPSWMQSRMVDN